MYIAPRACGSTPLLYFTVVFGGVQHSISSSFASLKKTANGIEIGFSGAVSAGHCPPKQTKTSSAPMELQSTLLNLWPTIELISMEPQTSLHCSLWSTCRLCDTQPQVKRRGPAPNTAAYAILQSHLILQPADTPRTLIVIPRHSSVRTFLPVQAFRHI